MNEKRYVCFTTLFANGRFVKHFLFKYSNANAVVIISYLLSVCFPRNYRNRDKIQNTVIPQTYVVDGSTVGDLSRIRKAHTIPY